LASRISSKVCAALLFTSVLACGSKTENKPKPLAGAGAANNTAVVANDPAKTADPAANGSGTPTATPTPTADAADAMKYIAENSNTLVVVDVKKLFASPYMAYPEVKAEIDKLKTEDDFKKLIDAGIDPFTNVDKVVISGDSGKEMFVIVVTGTFDAAKAGEAAKAEMAKDGKGAIEVVGGNTLILSEKPESIALAKSAKGVDGSPALKDAWSMVDATRAMYVLAAIPAEAAANFKELPVPGLASAKTVAFGLNIDKGFDMMVNVQLGSEADATAAKGGVEQFLPMAAMLQIPQEVTSALKVEAKGTNLMMSLALTEDQLKKIEETMKQMGAGAPGMTPPMAPMPMPEGGAAPGAEK
jgi:hypothetical protein